MKGSGRELFKALSRILLGGTEEHALTILTHSVYSNLSLYDDLIVEFS